MLFFDVGKLMFRKFDCHNNESELPHHFLSKNCSSVLHEVEGENY